MNERSDSKWCPLSYFPCCQSTSWLNYVAIERWRSIYYSKVNKGLCMMVWYLEGFGSNLKQITWLWRLISSWFMDVIPCVNTVGDVDFSAVISIRKGTNNIIGRNLFTKTTLIKIRSREKKICTYLSPFLTLHNQRLSSVKVFRPFFLQRQMVLSETLSSLPKNQFQTKGKHHSNRWKKPPTTTFLSPKKA